MLRACARRGPASTSSALLLRPQGPPLAIMGCRAFSIEASKVIWYNGEMVPWESANVHILSTAVQFGMSMFEGIRTNAAS